MNNPMPLENKPSLSELRSRFHTRPISEGIVSEVADKASGIVLSTNDWSKSFSEPPIWTEDIFGPDGFDADGYDRAWFNLAGLDRNGNRWVPTVSKTDLVMDFAWNQISKTEAERRHTDPDYALWKYRLKRMSAEEYLACVDPEVGVRKWMDGLYELNDIESQPDSEQKGLMRHLAERLGILSELNSAIDGAWRIAYRKTELKKNAGKKTWIEKSWKPWISYHHNG